MNVLTVSAICKLFMGYTNSSKTYIGTGWLIADDLLVTAGHCSYDLNLGFLKWMKVYIGYAGPESVKAKTCQYRQAASVAMPAEYLKAASVTHDVSFVSIIIATFLYSTDYRHRSNSKPNLMA